MFDRTTIQKNVPQWDGVGCAKFQMQKKKTFLRSPYMALALSSKIRDSDKRFDQNCDATDTSFTAIKNRSSEFCAKPVKQNETKVFV